MSAALRAPIEMPATQFGAMPSPLSASKTPAWYAPSAPPPCSTRTTSSCRARSIALRLGRALCACRLRVAAQGPQIERAAGDGGEDDEHRDGDEPRVPEERRGVDRRVFRVYRLLHLLQARREHAAAQ